MKKLLAVALSLPVLAVAGAPAAFAGIDGALATTSGSSAKWRHADDTFRICDNASDGHSVYVKFYYSGSGGELQLNWTGGAGTCTVRPYDIGEGKTVTYKSCIADTLWDTCSGWVTGVA